MHSKPLGSMITSGMTESSSGSITLDDIDSATFTRVAEYLYRGTYTTNSAERQLAKQQQAFARKCADTWQKHRERNLCIGFYCLVCQKIADIKDDSEFPYCDIACKTSKQIFTPNCTWCNLEIADNAVLCKQCEDKLFGRRTETPSPKGWSQFKMKGAGATGTESLATSQNSQECEITMDELLTHASVWVSGYAKPVTCKLGPSLICLR
jgi:hypothetical protein